jgi:hypothetical protein
MAPQHVLNLKRGRNKVMPISKPSLCGSFHPVKSGPYQGDIVYPQALRRKFDAAGIYRWRQQRAA